MKINSLARRTDLIFARFGGTVTDKGSYTLVQTPTNPSYHWGNYMIFDAAPKIGDFFKWTQLFKKEFNYYKNINHMTFTWEGTPLVSGDYQEFMANKFSFDEAIVLTAGNVARPAKYNDKISVKKIITDKDWNDALISQTLSTDPKFASAGFNSFKKKQMDNYRAMSEKGMGNWFGAYINEQIVGDLGLFFEKELGRYQNVGTHPSFRRQGICQTLVYESAQIAFMEYGVSQLVMEADANYHAAKIYESVGFKPTERNYSLSWWVPHD